VGAQFAFYLVAVVSLVALLIFMSAKDKVQPSLVKRSRFLSVARSCTIAAVCLFVGMSFRISNSDFLAGGTRNDAGTAIIRNDALEALFPLKYAALFSVAIQERGVRQRIDTLRLALPTNARKLDENPAHLFLVLIIGESSASSHWQEYGYLRETTPTLSKRSDLIWLRDIVTQWPLSRMAVPTLLLPNDGTDNSGMPVKPSILTALNTAGFSTTWLSNQALFGRHDSPISQIAFEAKTRTFFNRGGIGQASPYDDIMLREIQELAAQPAEDRLVVLHTLGSHLNYPDRFPPDFAWFSKVGDSKYSIVNSYDDSVRFTDHLISSTIVGLSELGKNSPVAIIYVSDHGQDVDSPGCGKIGHGWNTVSTLRVPALVWLSPAYIAAWPDKLRALQLNSASPVSTRDIYSTVAGIANIETLGYSAESDLTSVRWKAKSRPIGRDGLDFDLAEPTPPCGLIIRNRGEQK
jgi:glucan phosphoethanolaminetransferase (alkaline phosphatase superfamily)